MDTFSRIVAQITAGVLFLFALFNFGVINQESAVIIGIIAVALLFCFQELKFSINPIRDATAEIQRFLGDYFDFVPLHEVKPTGYVEVKSPIGLTELGRRLLETSGAKDIIDENYNELERTIDEKGYRNAYDVQTYISKLIAQKEDENFMKPLKDFVYNNPKFEQKPLRLTDVQRIMVIYLRNKYLNHHPEITSQEK